VAKGTNSARLDSEMITEVNEESGFVVVDTNHPLAGMTLEFDVTVVAVRDAPATAGCGKA
jgi:FKBP-type peptidyl-prolyl cis-trans isomerase SlyD